MLSPAASGVCAPAVTAVEEEGEEGGGVQTSAPTTRPQSSTGAHASTGPDGSRSSSVIELDRMTASVSCAGEVKRARSEWETVVGGWTCRGGEEGGNGGEERVSR